MLCCLSFFTTTAQVRKFKNHEVLPLPNGIYVEVLSCRGEGANEICDVIYYTDKRQNGKRLWKLADSLRLAIKGVQKPNSAVMEIVPSAIANKMTNKPDTSLLNFYRFKSTIGVDVNNQVNKDENSPSVLVGVSAPTVTPAKSVEPYVSAQKTTDHFNASAIVKDTSKQALFKKENTLSIDRPVVQSLDSPATKKLSVFVDCNTDCDMNFIKTELTLVDFFLDRTVADVHILINEQSTGGGGGVVQLIFYGQQGFKKMQDTLNVGIPVNSTSFERRAEILKGLKKGLFPFLLKTPYAKYIELSMKLPEAQKATKPVSAKDPWNYWVVRLGVDGTFNTDEVYKSLQGNGYVVVNRITDKTKLNFAASGSYNKYEYNYDDNGTNRKFEVLNSDYLFQHSLIASLGNHWGVGYQAAYSNSTFSNNKSRLYGKAAIEYSIFPYKDVNTRFFTVSYGVDVRSNTYYDTTIYFKTSEVLFGQNAQANLSLNQKWGTINSSIAYSNYFKEASLNNLSARLEFNIRITGGLSMYFYSSGAHVRDQIYLVKGKASEQDVLTRRRQIASSYNFYSGLGLNFRFGSKLNNFVNARLGNL